MMQNKIMRNFQKPQMNLSMLHSKRLRFIISKCKNILPVAKDSLHNMKKENSKPIVDMEHNHMKKSLKSPRKIKIKKQLFQMKKKQKKKKKDNHLIVRQKPKLISKREKMKFIHPTGFYKKWTNNHLNINRRINE